MTKFIAPILLYNDECAVCRSIAGWVSASAKSSSAASSIDVRPIGDDPEALRSLNPSLDIWDAYKTIHILRADGSMRTGGEAVAETLRNLPNCRWFAWTFSVGAFGFRPFQFALDGGYFVLADLRPLLGCESCGIPNHWVKHVASAIAWMRGTPARPIHPSLSPHSRSPGA